MTKSFIGSTNGRGTALSCTVFYGFLIDPPEPEILFVRSAGTDMSCLRISKSKKITAGIIIFMMFFVVLFSAFFIATEANHHCEDENCPICALIAMCEHTLRQAGDGAVRLITVLFPISFILIAVFLQETGRQQETLISKKVRLNN